MLSLAAIEVRAAAITLWADLADDAPTGKNVTIEGYLLPVDRDGDMVYEFLLVPTAGACSHMPQPPANQLVHVFPAKPYPARENYEAIAVTGVLQAELEQTQFYMIDGVKVVESAFSMSRADIRPATDLKPAPPATGNPLLSKRK